MTKKRSKEQPDQANLPTTDLVKKMQRDAGLGVPNESSPATEADDPMAGVAFGHGVLEHILLAIIDAKPSKKGEKTREQRLKAAMKALIGRGPTKAPLPLAKGQEENDGHRRDRALLFMADQWHLERTKPSASELARQAVVRFFPTSDPTKAHRSVEDLVERFTGSYIRNRQKGVPAHDVPQTLVYRIAQHDYIRESVERQICVRICEELEQAGVGVSLPDAWSPDSGRN